MEITLPQLQSYLFAIEQIPPFTPKRWDLISECVTKLSKSSESQRIQSKARAVMK